MTYGRNQDYLFVALIILSTHIPEYVSYSSSAIFLPHLKQ